MLKPVTDHFFLMRASQIARLAGKKAAPNPRVGAVLVHEDVIIGEGYHEQAGQAHAEVLALASVADHNQPFISASTMYVTLEPCAHHGNTPPCANALVNAKVKRVVIGNYDPSEKVNGKGITILSEAGIELTVGLSKMTETLPHVFFESAIKNKRPYTFLKFARSQDGFLGQSDKAVWLTNSWSKRLVHAWRAEIGALLIGTNTALVDDPKLTTRFGFGHHPLRIIPDFNDRLHDQMALFATESPVWILCETLPKHGIDKPFVHYQLLPKKHWPQALNQLLIAEGINTLMIEGGAKILSTYLQEKLWDEARVFETGHTLKSGIAAPQLPANQCQASFALQSDVLKIYRPALSVS